MLMTGCILKMTGGNPCQKPKFQTLEKRPETR